MIRLIHSLSTWISGIWGKSCLIILAVPSFILGILVCCEVSNTHDIGARRNKRLWLITYKIWFLSKLWFMFMKCFFVFLADMAGSENFPDSILSIYSGELWLILYGVTFSLKSKKVWELPMFSIIVVHKILEIVIRSISSPKVNSVLCGAGNSLIHS